MYNVYTYKSTAMIIRKLKGIYLPHETSESVLKVPHQKTFFSAPTTTVTVMPEPGGAGGGTQRAKITEKVHKPPRNHYIE